MPPITRRQSSSSAPARQSASGAVQKAARVKQPKRRQEEELVCTICFEALSKKRDVKTSCAHRFHRTCLINWLETINYKSEHLCPNCRAPITSLKDGRKTVIIESFGKYQQPTLFLIHSSTREEQNRLRQEFCQMLTKALESLEDKARSELVSVEAQRTRAVTKKADADFLAEIDQELVKLQERISIYQEMATLKAGYDGLLPDPMEREKWNLEREFRRLRNEPEERFDDDDDSDSSSDDSERSSSDSESDFDEDSFARDMDAIARIFRARNGTSSDQDDSASSSSESNSSSDSDSDDSSDSVDSDEPMDENEDHSLPALNCVGKRGRQICNLGGYIPNHAYQALLCAAAASDASRAVLVANEKVAAADATLVAATAATRSAADARRRFMMTDAVACSRRENELCHQLGHRFPRECAACKSENPRVRVFLPACGHAVCRACAEERARREPGAARRVTTCPLCDVDGSFVKLREEAIESD